LLLFNILVCAVAEDSSIALRQKCGGSPCDPGTVIEHPSWNFTHSEISKCAMCRPDRVYSLFT
jgi:hypothetical protein